MNAKKVMRKIIEIDENKCDGCGICANACHEGAIAIIDKKAKLIKDSYCDGLGDCIGECPQDAIKIIEREADDYDEEAVIENMKKNKQTFSGCPGSMAKSLNSNNSSKNSDIDKNSNFSYNASITSKLQNWPTQLMLVPINAPYFENADLLFVADCVPFAFADIHNRFMKNRITINACPKLDDTNYYKSKLIDIFKTNSIRTIEVLYMEVPCCGGLVMLIKQAIEESGKNIPINFIKIGIKGNII